MLSDPEPKRLANYPIRDYHAVGRDKYPFTYTGVLDRKCVFSCKARRRHCRGRQVRPPLWRGRPPKGTRPRYCTDAHLLSARLRLVPICHGRC